MGWGEIMKKNNFFAPSQMTILSDIGIGGEPSGGDFAKPDPILDDEIILPGGDSVGTEDGDITVAPVVPDDSDMAYTEP